MNPLYQVLGAVIGYLISQLVRWVQRGKFWQRVQGEATRALADPSIPVDDAREAAERALVEAQRSQLDAVERSIRAGGNGFRH